MDSQATEPTAGALATPGTSSTTDASSSGRAWLIIGLGALVFAALIGAITWNYFTWWIGMPSSSSHALIGGLLRAIRNNNAKREFYLTDAVALARAAGHRTVMITAAAEPFVRPLGPLLWRRLHRSIHSIFV